LQRRACSAERRSVSNMVRPMVYTWLPRRQLGGQALVWNSGCGAAQAPAGSAPRPAALTQHASLRSACKGLPLLC
jgi:hypothetical protein